RAPIFLASYPETLVTRSNQARARLTSSLNRIRQEPPQKVVMSLVFRPCLPVPQCNQKSRLLDKRRAIAIVPNNMVSTSHLLFEWHLRLNHYSSFGSCDRHALLQTV